MLSAMARAATTSDVFNAIAEPQRRRILVLLQSGEKAVNVVADAMRIAQSRASKHLRVLREVGLVRARGEGRQRLYRLDARGLREVHEWTGGFEAFWSGSFDRLATYVRELQESEGSDESG
jgi:DNA-binding transcriptional ArsR family regulator